MLAEFYEKKKSETRYYSRFIPKENTIKRNSFEVGRLFPLLIHL